MIESNWFKELVHNLSHTGFGVYKNLGSHIMNYAPDSLRERIDEARIQYDEPEIKGAEVFDVGEISEQGQGIANLKATLNPAYP